MPVNHLAAADKRLEKARKRTTYVDGLAQKVKSTTREKRFDTAFYGAGWRVYELIVKHALAKLGSISYLVVCLIGLVYSRGFYGQFESVRILELFHTPDFLLSAFGSLKSLIIGLIALVVLLLGLLSIYSFSNHRRAYRSVKFEDDQLTLKWKLRCGVLVGVAVFAFLLVPFYFGKEEGFARAQEGQFVQVVSRDSTLPNTLLRSSRMRLLSTTSNFHIFYKCEVSGSYDSLNRCGEDGHALVVPTDNVASVEFIKNDSHNPENGLTSSVELPEEFRTLLNAIIVEAVTRLQDNCSSSLEKIARIGPFGQGEDELELPEDDQTFVLIRQRFVEMFPEDAQRAPPEIILIGRVDATQFSRESRASDGSDVSLARNRARWVLDEVLVAFVERRSVNQRRCVNKRRSIDHGPSGSDRCC